MKYLLLLAIIFLPIERAIANLRYERAIAWDSDGHLLFDSYGGLSHTTVIYDKMKLLWDGTLTHNHPSGYPEPSYADMEFAWYWQLKELRVVSGSKLRVIDRIGRFWSIPPYEVWNTALKSFRNSQCDLGCAADKTWEKFAPGHYSYSKIN